MHTVVSWPNLYVVFHHPSFACCFSSLYFFLLWNTFFLYTVLCTTMFHRRSLDTFLWMAHGYHLCHACTRYSAGFDWIILNKMRKTISFFKLSFGKTWPVDKLPAIAKHKVISETDYTWIYYWQSIISIYLFTGYIIHENWPDFPI